MKKKFIIKLEGGLGNQLFQYAHAIAMQKLYDADLYMDQHAFTKKQQRNCALNNYKLNNRSFLRLPFFIKIVSYIYIFIIRFIVKCVGIKTQTQYVSNVDKGLYFQYKIRWFDSFISPSCRFNYVTGNWLSLRFFDIAEDEVRSALTLKSNLPFKLTNILDDIKSTDSVCLHVRLGDYLSPQWKDKLYVCTPQYYQKAIEVMRNFVPNAKFYVFSNRHKDFEMIQKEYNLGDVFYVDMGNTDVEDMELMRNCKHFIMSNSTYSWWGQYLAESPNKVVVAPSRFNNYPQWDMSDIYMDSWITIDV